MYPLSAWRLARGLEGELLGRGIRGEFSRVSTDTRSLKRGDVYVALQGASFDGEKFFRAALQKGAGALVGKNPPSTSRAAVIRVKDSLTALQRLARDQRRQFQGPVIAITGSNGKTGAKEMLAQLLGDDVLSTPGNWNNHIGMPLTLLSMEKRHKAAVLELGMNHEGELRFLGGICRPNVAIELNVGDAHIGHFKSRTRVAAAKEELLQSMGASGLAILNGDDPLVAAMGRRFKGRMVRFGMGPENELRVRVHSDRGVQGLDGVVEWRAERRHLSLPMGGRARLTQAMASLAGALAVGRELKSLLRRLKSFKPLSRGRQQIEKYRGVNFILDAYNASPQSMLAALELLKQSAPRGRRVALLGDMLELGPSAAAFHRELGKNAKASGLRELAALGPNAKRTLEGFGDGVAFRVDQAGEAADWLRSKIQPGDWVLLKGSRGMAVERVFEAFKRGN